MDAVVGAAGVGGTGFRLSRCVMDGTPQLTRAYQNPVKLSPHTNACSFVRSPLSLPYPARLGAVQHQSRK